MDSFAELFTDFWWLLFPFGFLLYGGWNSLMRVRQTQARFELLKTYAQTGQEPPAALLADIQAQEEAASVAAPRQNGATLFVVTLFAGLAGIFAILGYTGALGPYAAEFYVVAAILGVLALAFLVSGVATGGHRAHT